MRLAWRPHSGRIRGFTLLELLVVLAILGFLATIAVPQVLKYLSGAKTKTAVIQVQQLGATLDLYRLDIGRYPTDEQGLEALLEPPPDAENWNGPYLKKQDMLMDPWGNIFDYRYPGRHGEYDLYTLGADEAEGGEGEDQDIVSW
ncbi:MAG: type II secretion system major pseudopilin GspG [Alphaproteobacteria bacterium]